MTNESTALPEVLSASHVVLFDFDGPLCDVFAGLPAREVARRLESLLGERFETDDPLEILRMSPQSGPAALMAVEDELIAAELEAVDCSTATPGGLEAIGACLKAKKKVGVVSNNSGQAVARFLLRVGLLAEVKPVIGRAYANPNLMKPNPFPLQTALTNLRISPDHAVFVGDSQTDIEAGRAVGTHVVAYANSARKRAIFTQRDVLVIDSMTELVTALGNNDRP